MLLFQCSLQCYFLCSGDASPGCWDQTPGMNRAACTWGCSKKYLFSAGDLKKPLGLRTLWFACSLPLRPRNVPGANLVLPQVTQDTWQQHRLSKVPLWASSSEECFPKHYGPWCSWCLCAFLWGKFLLWPFFNCFACLSDAFASLARTEFAPWQSLLHYSDICHSGRVVVRSN